MATKVVKNSYVAIVKMASKQSRKKRSIGLLFEESAVKATGRGRVISPSDHVVKKDSSWSRVAKKASQVAPSKKKRPPIVGPEAIRVRSRTET